MQEGNEELMTAQNTPVPEGAKFLYRHLIDNQQIVDIEGYDHNILHIFSKEVLSLVRNGNAGFEMMVPSKVAALIKEKFLFGYPYEQKEFEY
jgi:hypothetical protein